ncbi:MAG: YcaQ family DNA glycosylase [Burkholderiales bacterium]|nr:YcaQ family DNA glycosylase [Burkholderiales bacterium]
MARPPTLDELRRYAVARSLFAPTTLARAIDRLGFVQADPIRAPARAQDLTLRHRVRDYRAGDLERRYAQLDIEEDYFVNYGFVPRRVQALMHPRQARTPWPTSRRAQAQAVLEFVRAQGVVHPREVDAQFAHGKVKNWFGGNSNATTQLLDGMHYRGLVRVAAREGGVRLYAAREAAAETPDPETALDALADIGVAKYAPLPERTLSDLMSRLRIGAPQWHAGCRGAFVRAKSRLASTRIDGQNWYWPAHEKPASRRYATSDEVRLLAPFDPVVWDRRRFEAFWGWAYRFEAYTPAAKRTRGYYALPLLWRDAVIGWGNLAWRDGKLDAEIGYASGRAPRDAGYRQALAVELDRVAAFLGGGETSAAG